MDGYRRSFLANGLAALVLGFSACDAAAGHRRKGSKATTIRRIDKVAYVPSPLLGEELSNPKRTIMVYTFEQLQSAVNQAKPGDHIVLQDESYGTSKLSIGVSGTAQDPIVIRARNVLGPSCRVGSTMLPAPRTSGSGVSTSRMRVGACCVEPTTSCAGAGSGRSRHWTTRPMASCRCRAVTAVSITASSGCTPRRKC